MFKLHFVIRFVNVLSICGLKQFNLVFHVLII